MMMSHQTAQLCARPWRKTGPQSQKRTPFGERNGLTSALVKPTKLHPMQHRKRGLDKGHPVSNSTLVDFHKHLTARMGANLEDSTADQQVRNVAKVLYFINPTQVQLMDLYQTKKTDYLDAMKECGVGRYGQRTRVDGCVQALAYMKTEQDGVSITEVDRAMAKLDQFKTWLRERGGTAR